MNSNSKAKEIIQTCINTQSKRLDIGQCGLTEIPVEILKMDWLEELILGNNPTVPEDYEYLKLDESLYKKVFPLEGKMTVNDGEPNNVTPDSNFILSGLPNLKYLNICRVGYFSFSRLDTLNALSILIAGENRTLVFPGVESPVTSTKRSNSNTEKIQAGLEILKRNARKNKIEVLDLGRCELAEYKWIFAAGNTGNLRFLNLNSFNYENLVFLTDLPELISLNISYLKKKLTVTKEEPGNNLIFRNNKKLQFLRIDFSELKDTVAFEGLDELGYLNINNNQIESLENLRLLSRIKSLYIEKNLISDLSPLSGMTSIEIFHCSGNRIKSILPLDNLTNIKEFIANNNEIEDLKPLGKWRQPEHISICNNKISNIETILKLHMLKEILLTDNHISSLRQVEQLSAFPGLTILKLFGNPVENLPHTLLGKDSSENCLSSLQNYFTSLQSGHTKNIEIKLILVGNSTAGKTTLRKLLQNKTYNPREDSTHGIVMETWKLKGKSLSEFSDLKELQINIWDFGGQEYYHETHKLFFSNNAVYILIWEDETNKHFIKDTKVFEMMPDGTTKERTKYIEHQPYQYWLKNIRHYANSCPVIIVQNQIDKYLEKKQTGDQPSMPVRIKRVENKVLDDYQVDESFDLSLKRYAEKKVDYIFEYQKFERHLTRVLAETTGNFNIAKSFLEVKKIVEERRQTENLLDYTQFTDICRETDPALLNNLDGLSKFLTDTSTILYYPDHPVLSEKVFINPVWVSETIYKILDKEVLERSGEFNLPHVTNKIGDKLTNTFLELMKEFQLIFQVHTRDKTEIKYVAPQFLPEGAATRSYSIFKSQCNQARLVMRFPQFLPKTFMNGVLSKFAGRSIDKSYYRYGVAFESEWLTQTGEENINIIECDFDKSEISVYSKSPNPYNLREIFEAMLTVYAGFRHTPALAAEPQRTATNILNIVASSKTPLHISADGQNFVSWNELHERWNNTTMEALPLTDDSIILPVEGSPVTAGLFKPYYIHKSDVQSMATVAKIQEPPKLFISYSHKDELYKDELLEHLSGMRRNGEIKDWTDRAILPGEKWDEAIAKNLNEANIVLFLISSSFVASEYIQNIEIRKAIERHNHNKLIIIPIPVRPCDYKSLPLKEIQSASKDFKPISTGYVSHDEGWTEVIGNLRLTIDNWKQQLNNTV